MKKGRDVITTPSLELFSERTSIEPVPDLDKERSKATPLVRLLPIPHLQDWRKMELFLINFN